MLSSQPQPVDGRTRGDPPVLDLPEGNYVLYHLLRLCYPVRNFPVDDLAMAGSILQAAIKYDMDGPIQLAKEAFHELSRDEPLHAFAISCQLQLEEEAASAASLWKEIARTRRHRVDDSSRDFADTCVGASYVPQMADISAGAFYRLVQFVRGDEVTGFCSPPSPTSEQKNAEGSQDPSALSPEGGVPHGATLPAVDGSPERGARREPAAEADDEDKGPCDTLNNGYPFNQSDADYVVRSSDDVDFKVHRLILKLHTTTEAEGAVQSLAEDTGLVVDGLAAVKVQETGRVVREMLLLCYPAFPGSPSIIPQWDVSKLYETYPVIVAARRYGLSAVVAACRALACTLGRTTHDSWAFPLYCVAVGLGWDPEAEVVASTIARHGPGVFEYDRMMETMPAEKYYRLLRYCHRYRRNMAGKLCLIFGLPRYRPMLLEGQPYRTNFDEYYFQSVPLFLVEEEAQSALYQVRCKGGFRGRNWHEIFNCSKLMERAATWFRLTRGHEGDIKL